jgi:hypothetical protein
MMGVVRCTLRHVTIMKKDPCISWSFCIISSEATGVALLLGV